MKDQTLIIGGRHTAGETTFPVTNPYDGTEIARVHSASRQQIEEAIVAAGEGYAVTSQYSSFERSEILHSIVSMIRSRKEEFAELITAEAGKPITSSRAEVDRAITTFDIAAEESKRIYGETIPLDITNATKGRYGMVNRFPIGIVLCISPYNFPLNLVAHKIAPAIATGNAFILKPPSYTPLTSLALGEVLLKSGLEAKSINIVPTTTAHAELMVKDDRIAMVSFTGSAHVGWKLKEKAAKKRVTLELGGNAAVIVDASADIPRAVARCVLGAYGFAGQVCIKVQRIYAHEDVYEEFLDQLVKATNSVVTGDPRSEKTLVGPLITEQEAIRVEAWVNESVLEGATVLTGGKREGSLYFPTVLTNVTSTMKICSEEVFGPVVTVGKFTTINDAVAMVNDSRYGLQAGVFSNDHSSVQYVYRHLHVGGVIINDYPTFRVDTMPYGGIKDSGFGREGIRYAMDEMLEKKLLVL